jgi:septal ring factor EnvC (AmiA/AmiB activator)
VFAQAPEEDRLRAVEQGLKDSEAEKARIEQRREAVTAELTALRTTMIGLARDIQAQEESLGGLEARLAELEQDEVKLTSTLGLREEQMSRLVMALQRMALRPTDAVNLSPLQPDEAVRAAILLRAAIPEVQTSAKALEKDLTQLYRLRAEATEQQQKVALAASGLLDKRRALETKEQDKLKLQGELAAASAEAAAKMQRLAAEAKDLKQLVEKVLAERAAKAAAARVVLKPPPGAAPDKSVPGEAQTAALPAPSAPKPSDLKAFSQARGTMPFPAVGTLKKRYGEDAGDKGAMNRGIVIATRPGGQVIAPFDGVVAFAGPFRGYGLLLIIEHSEGYHTLLAGLGRIDSVLDQRVFAGEPVGTMGDEPDAGLYVELRQNGQPVNPLPWLASRPGGKSNG